MNNFAVLLRRSGRPGEADRVYSELVEVVQTAFGPDHLNTLSLMSNRAAVLVDLGQFDQASELYKKALTGIEAKLGQSHPSARAIAGKLKELEAKRGTAKAESESQP
jgi:hypothetical protein